MAKLQQGLKRACESSVDRVGAYFLSLLQDPVLGTRCVAMFVKLDYNLAVQGGAFQFAQQER